MTWYCPTCDKEIDGGAVSVGSVNEERGVTTYHVITDGPRTVAIHRVRAQNGNVAKASRAATNRDDENETTN